MSVLGQVFDTYTRHVAEVMPGFAKGVAQRSAAKLKQALHHSVSMKLAVDAGNTKEVFLLQEIELERATQ